jgi:hypothetical protein
MATEGEADRVYTFLSFFLAHKTYDSYIVILAGDTYMLLIVILVFCSSQWPRGVLPPDPRRRLLLSPGHREPRTKPRLLRR